MEIRDIVHKNIPTTTENILHYYVQKTADAVGDFEETVRTGVTKGIGYFTEGLSNVVYVKVKAIRCNARSKMHFIKVSFCLFSYACVIVGAVVLIIVILVSLKFCYSIYKQERDVKRYCLNFYSV